MIHSLDNTKGTRKPATEVLTAARVLPDQEAANARVTDNLARLVADTYRLILKAQNFHWNVEGPQFSALHGLFEEQYGELREALDEAAERMRALGVFAPATFAEYEALSTVQDAPRNLSASEMCRTLAADYRKVSETAAHVIAAASEIGDEGTADLATSRVRVSDKAAWILESHVT